MYKEESGIIPCTNCVTTVPQDRRYAVERFGSAVGVLEPGLHFVGVDLCGACITFKSISTRQEQFMVSCPTKTLDNVFVKVVVAVQAVVTNPQDAIYKLQNVESQLDSYVSAIVREAVPKMNIEDAFSNKDDISDAVQDRLGSQMEAFGWRIHKALVVDIKVNEDVMRAMNEVNRQSRLRDASIMAAEAAKIQTVRKAEAAADAACLQGQGIARQRSAIIEGLRNSLTQGKPEDISVSDISSLLLTTQYFDTLRSLGGRNTAQTFFMPQDSGDELDMQVLLGMLQGQVALEYFDGMPGFGPSQNVMDEPEPDPAPSPSLGRPGGRKRPSVNSDSSLAPQPAPAQAPSLDFPPSSSPPPSRPAPAAPTPAPMGRQVIQVQVPPGVQPGQQLQFSTPDGRVLRIQVPPGAVAGTTLQIQV